MKRSIFLKRLFGGIAAVAVAPVIDIVVPEAVPIIESVGWNPVNAAPIMVEVADGVTKSWMSRSDCNMMHSLEFKQACNKAEFNLFFNRSPPIRLSDTTLNNLLMIPLDMQPKDTLDLFTKHGVYDSMRSNPYYILDENKQPVNVSLAEYASWHYKASRTHGTIMFRSSDGLSVVSTVFLGVSYDTDALGRPLIFETLVFNGPRDGEMIRDYTYEDAKATHLRMCQRIMTSTLTGHISMVKPFVNDPLPLPFIHPDRDLTDEEQELLVYDNPVIYDPGGINGPGSHTENSSYQDSGGPDIIDYSELDTRD